MKETLGEYSFLDDILIEGGKKDGLNNGTSYKEAREFKTEDHHVRFYFVTRCLNPYVESIMLDMQEEPYADIFIMNSCLWDISRYGKDSMAQYKTNILSLFSELNTVLSRDCLTIWTTTPPVSKNARGGFLPPDEEFRHAVLSNDINEANLYTKCAAHYFDITILDLFFHLCDHCELQVQDGIHWDMMAHRYITNLILELVCDAMGTHVPFRPTQLNMYVNSRFPNNCNEFENFLPNSIADSISQQNRINNCLSQVLTPRRSSRRNQNRPQTSSPFPIHNSFNSSNFFQSPNSFHSANSFQSPNSFHSFQSPASLIASPLQWNSPSCYWSPNNQRNPSSFHSPDNVRDPSFYEDDHFDFKSPIFLQSPNHVPNHNHAPNALRREASRYSQAYNNPLGEIGGNALLNLGQYNQQDEHLGVIRHNVRRRCQPYRGKR